MNNLPAVRQETALAALPLDEGMKWAHVVYKSGMAPAHFKSPEAVYVAACMGEELGFSRLQAVNSVDVINGVPGLKVAGMKALIIRAGGRFNVESWDEKHCTITMVRGDWKETQSYTIEDAKRQGLAGKDNWVKMPRAMLYARCFASLGRNLFADVLKGIYLKEELIDGYDVVVDTPKPELPAPVRTIETVATPTDGKAPQEQLFKLIEAWGTVDIGRGQLELALAKDVQDFTAADVAWLREKYTEVKKHGVDALSALGIDQEEV